MNLRNKRILVTGGSGFIGSHLVENLIKVRKIDSKKIIVPLHKETDLKIFENAYKLAKKVDIIFHLASDMGGVRYSNNNPAKQYYNCSLLDLQMLEAAKNAGVKKILMVSSACAYADDSPFPLLEKNIFSGRPAKTHDGYGMAKRMSVFLTEIYRRQYNTNVVVVVPNNTYGSRDNFNLKDGHVIPSLIKRCLTEKKLTIWGDGKTTRDFIYVEDTAEGMILAMEKLETSDPVNLGTGIEIMTNDLVNLIVKLTGFKGEIIYDSSMPRGQSKRLINIDRAKKLLGFKPKWSLEEGIRRTIEWYKENYQSK